MTVLQMIPAQVYFLIAFGAVVVLLADTAVRSWRSPERVADPSYIWPRPAPVVSEQLIGPRLPSGSFSPHPMFLVGARAAAVRPALDVDALRESYRGIAGDRYERLRAGDWNDLDAEPEDVVTIKLDNRTAIFTPGATLDWSPIAEQVAAEARRLPLDDVDEWLAERVREFEHALSRIECRRVSLVRGEPQATLDEQIARFVEGSQQLHEYRMFRIGETGGYGPREHMQLEALLANA